MDITMDQHRTGEIAPVGSVSAVLTADGIEKSFRRVCAGTRSAGASADTWLASVRRVSTGTATGGT